MKFKIAKKDKTNYQIAFILTDIRTVAAFKKAASDMGAGKSTLLRKMVEHCLKEAGYLE